MNTAERSLLGEILNLVTLGRLAEAIEISTRGTQNGQGPISRPIRTTCSHLQQTLVIINQREERAQAATFSPTVERS